MKGLLILQIICFITCLVSSAQDGGNLVKNSHIRIPKVTLADQALENLIQDFIEEEKECLRNLEKNEGILITLGFSGSDTVLQMQTRDLDEVLSLRKVTAVSCYRGYWIYVCQEDVIRLFFDQCEKNIEFSLDGSSFPNYFIRKEDTLYFSSLQSNPSYVQWGIWYSKINGFEVGWKFPCAFLEQSRFLDSLHNAGWRTPSVSRD